MTGNARIQVEISETILMAVAADDLPLPGYLAMSLQRKANQFMREITFQKLGQAGLWAVMISMTFPAVQLIHFSHHRPM